MVEFQEVIKHFKRMCRYTNYSGLPNECPLYCKGHGCNIDHCRKLAFDDKKFQNVVMTWAETHPEPVYSTWGEWFVSIGFLPDKWDGLTSAYTYVGCVPNLLHSPIPADIAQKLGVEPKEG